jgi:hypothetical protein
VISLILKFHSFFPFHHWFLELSNLGNCFLIMQLQKACNDHLHFYHEAHDDHHIAVKDGTS